MKKTSRLARISLIAAAYAVLTLAFPPLSYGPVQIRISEALCVLPFFMPEAVAGLTAGCFLANLIGVSLGATLPWDIIVGTLATFVAAFLSAKIKNKWLLPLPAVMVNAFFIGIMLTVFMTDGTNTLLLGYNILTVGAGQAIACYGAGIPLFRIFQRIIQKEQNKEEKMR